MYEYVQLIELKNYLWIIMSGNNQEMNSLLKKNFRISNPPSNISLEISNFPKFSIKWDFEDHYFFSKMGQTLLK